VREALSVADRSRVGARRPRWRGEFSLPLGDCPPENLPEYASRWKKGPEPVGLYSPNAYGLYNLGDNVHEWCSDWYDAGYYACSPERNPQGPAMSSRRASRGGSWRHYIKVTRASARSSIRQSLSMRTMDFVLRGVRLSESRCAIYGREPYSNLTE